MRKIWAMTWKSLYTSYTDRNLVLIMLVTPLALATIIGLALGNFIGNDDSNDIPVNDLPIVIVNLDKGYEETNFGQVFSDLMIPPEGEAEESDTLPTCDRVKGDDQEESENSDILLDLTEAVAMDDPEEARAAVSEGQFYAAIIIPADFSERMAYSQDHPEVEPVTVEVFGHSAAPFVVDIIVNITDVITGQMTTGQITIASVSGALMDRLESDPEFAMKFGPAAAEGKFDPDFSCAFNPGYSPLRLEQQTITGESASAAGNFDPLTYFGAANAIFFMAFTAQAGANGLLWERREWTLQRMLTTPTPRIVVLLGRLFGAFVNCIVQLAALFMALMLVGSLISGELKLIWGTNIVNILLVVVSAALAACGMGTLINGLARTPEQGNVIGSAITILMALVGGAFFPVQALQRIPILGFLPYLTFNYWGVDAFTKLSIGQGDILPNVAILLGLGTVMFSIGLWLFNRRMDV